MSKLILCVAAAAATFATTSCVQPEPTGAAPASSAAGAKGSNPSSGGSRSAPRSDASAHKSAGSPREAPEDRPPAPRRTFEDHRVAAGTYLAIELRTPIASDESQVQDEIRGRLTRPVSVSGVEVVPEGAIVRGVVTDVERSGRVKGRARVAFRFSLIEHPTTGSRVAIRTSPVIEEAQATKKKDAATIGGAAAGGAVIGAIVGGGDGAAKGAAIGGAAGTGVVLGTRGAEVHLPAGTIVSARLAEPFVVRIPD